MWKFILDLLFPISCLGCQQAGQFLCQNCLNQIPLFQKQPYQNLIITSFYDHPLLKEAILKYKYHFIQELAAPLSQLMIKQLKFKTFQNPIYCILYHPKSLLNYALFGCTICKNLYIF